MWDVIVAGGWLMLPIVLCSVLAMAIVIERLYALRSAVVAPPGLAKRVSGMLSSGRLDANHLRALRFSSPLGRILAAGLSVINHGGDRIKESVEDAGRHEIHRLERYLNTLGTIAAITPLLGLLGTVFGMIHVFSVITAGGMGDPTRLAGGISQALVTTAAGLLVAIPALVFYRYLRGRVEDLVVEMERQSILIMRPLRKREAPDSSAVDAAESARL